MATAAPNTPTDFVDIRKLSMNGMTPFISGPDIRDDACRGAHALLVMLATAFEDAAENDRLHMDRAPLTEGLNSQIKADALYGVATLLALSQYGADLAIEESQARVGRA